MAARFDSLCDVVPGRSAWRFKARVARVWEVSNYLRREQVNSIEMVLVDSKGGKIHATVRKQLLYLFQHKLEEGVVYNMSFFTVAPSSGAYRSTLHPYKLMFQMKTRLEVSEGPDISLYGLSLSTVEEICAHPPDYDYLVDAIGLLTGLSAEREYLRDSKVTKMIVIELTDHTGKCECALFGDYVGQFQRLVSQCSESMPVVIVQYAKVKMFRDKVSIQNVVNATRILIDPDIPEALTFKDGLALHGIESSAKVVVLGPRVRPSLEDDFLSSYPAISLSTLNSLSDDGTFVVCATIIGVVEGEDWWYPACKCHKSITPDSGAYYCSRCVKHVFQMIPRYRVKLRVTDGTADAVLVAFDSDMQYLLGEPCAALVASADADSVGAYPAEILRLEGSKILFKVSRVTCPGLLADGTFRIKRVCSDSAILRRFESVGTKPVLCEPPVKAKVVCGDQLSDSYPALSEAGVDDFVSSLLVSPSSSSLDQSGLSDLGSLNETPVRSSGASIVDDDVDDATPISVLLPRFTANHAGSVKRSLDSTFDNPIGDVAESSKKINKLG